MTTSPCFYAGDGYLSGSYDLAFTARHVGATGGVISFIVTNTSANDASAGIMRRTRTVDLPAVTLEQELWVIHENTAAQTVLEIVDEVFRSSRLTPAQRWAVAEYVAAQCNQHGKRLPTEIYDAAWTVRELLVEIERSS